MILSGSKSKALSWGGWALVLVLGAVLLPLLPIWAQEPAAQSPSTAADAVPAAEPQPAGVVFPQSLDGRMSPETIRQLLKQLEQTRALLLQTELRLQKALEQQEKSLRVRDYSMAPGTFAAPSTEKRLQDLEKKFELLLKKLESLHAPQGSLPPKQGVVN